jgi:hypothetical protein
MRKLTMSNEKRLCFKCYNNQTTTNRKGSRSRTILMAISPFLFACFWASAQEPLRCVSEPFFYSIKGESRAVKVNHPIAVCYNNSYFSFSCFETGTRTFKIYGRTTTKDEDGYVIESFGNEENATNSRMDYTVNITYGQEKVIVINFARFAEAYIVKSRSFLGSMTIQSGNNQLIKKNLLSIEKIKPDTITNVNFDLNPSLKIAHAITPIHIMNYINSRIEWTEKQKKVGDIGSFDFYFEIDTTGKICRIYDDGTTTKSYNLSAFNKGDRIDSLENKAKCRFLRMLTHHSFSC